MMKHVWENPEIQSLNRLPMRSPLIPFASMEHAARECALGPEACTLSKSPYHKSLDGIWRFALLESPNKEVVSWEKIRVPGTWTLQGYDAPHYTNVQMPFDTLPPNVPQKNPTGVYCRDVVIPRLWKKRRVVLHIGSAESCTIVFVNGIEVGVSKDTRLPCEFDITPFLQWSDAVCRATICIKVVRYSDASFVEDQDQWWFGGIHRSVYLYATKNIYIEDVQALTRVEHAGETNEKRMGVIPLVVKLGCALYNGEALTQTHSQHMRYVLRYAVHELAGTAQKGALGKCVAQGEKSGSYNYRDELGEMRATIKITNVKLWSSEMPHLYVLSVSLCESTKSGTAGRVIESTACTVGFKTVEISNRELRVNGKMIYIRGVNRHEHSEYFGKTLSLQEMVRDVHMLKSYNFNAVRTCHYPNDERWYELCDRYGLYVLDEANIENHAYYDNLARSDEWTHAYMTRVQRMVRRDKNHACIFGWSLGNESGCGQNHYALASWVRSFDSTRIVHYEGAVREELRQMPYTLDTLARGSAVTDIVAPMYPPIDLIVDYAEKRKDSRPLVMCEYAHAMGNACGSLADYWNAIENHHGLQGGFIWDWLDQGIAAKKIAKNGRTQKYWKYGGDFGDVPTDYDFCLNGINFPDGVPKPAMEECRHLFAPVRLRTVGRTADEKSYAVRGAFVVENCFDFLTINNILLIWEIRKNGTACEQGAVKLPAIQPGKSADVHIAAVQKAVATAKNGEELVLHVAFVYGADTPFAKAGMLIRSDEFMLVHGKGWQKYNALHHMSATPSSSVLPLALDVAKKFKPILFRALLENECVKGELPHLNDKTTPWCFQNKPTQAWLNSGIDNLLINKKSDVLFELVSDKPARKRTTFGTFEYKTKLCRAPDGSAAIQIDALFTLTNAVAEYPRVGITAPIDAAFNTVCWYGRGPHECYADRKASAHLGMYKMNAADMGVPYIVPQENGARCDVKYIELSNGKKTLHIQSRTPFTFSVSKYAVKDMFACRHTVDLHDFTSDKQNPHYMLTIDAAHRGVGTGACGPDTLEKYRVKPGVYKLCLRVW